MNERKWFYVNNEQKEGPVAESSLRQMVNKQILPPGVLVWTEGMSGWEPVSTVMPEEINANPSAHSSPNPNANPNPNPNARPNPNPNMNPNAPGNPNANPNARPNPSPIMNPHASGNPNPPGNPNPNQNMNSYPNMNPNVPANSNAHVNSNMNPNPNPNVNPNPNPNANVNPNANPSANLNRNSRPNPGQSPSSSPAPEPDASSGQVEWFYGANNKKHGPVSESEIRSLLQNGTLTAASLVWCEDFDDWKPASDVPQFHSSADSANESGPVRKTPPPRPSSSGAKAAKSGPVKNESPNAGSTKAGPNIGLLVVIAVVILGVAVAGAVFLGKSLFDNVVKMTPLNTLTQTQQPPVDPSAQSNQPAQTDPASPDTTSQNPPDQSSSAAVNTTPQGEDPSGLPVGMPPPDYVMETSKSMMEKIPSLKHMDCSAVPDKDPNYQQNLAIANGSAANQSGNTIWKFSFEDDELYFVFDPTFTKMIAYNPDDGSTEMVANIVPVNAYKPFPKEVYMYHYPDGELQKFGVLARPDVMYALSQDGSLAGYFSGTEFLEEGGSKGSMTVYPSR